MKLYVLENYKEIFPDVKGRKLTDRLIAEILEDSEVKYSKIARTDKGKPLVCGKDSVYVSVSHSGDVFACGVDEMEIGVDIQHFRKTDVMKLAERYFSSEEIKYVERGGNDAFFKLWTRKEAYSKYTGKGLEEIMGKVSVTDRKDVEFVDFQLEYGLYCSCCIKKR